MACSIRSRALRFGLLLALALASGNAVAQRLALSFEDGFDPQDRAHAALWNAAVLSALAEARVTTILFPAGNRLDTRDGRSLVEAWGEAGHAIGNCGCGVVDRNAARSGSAWIGDFKKTQAVLNDMPGWTPRFRLADPDLNRNSASRDTLLKWLAANHYKSAGLSIDVSDGYYSNRYLAWHSTHPNADVTRFRNAYLAHLWNRANYYDTLSTQLLHRSVPHVLRLHTNAINAAYLSDVIQMFRDNGWTIISPEQAYADKLYTAPTAMASSSGSVLWSMASERGVPGLRSPAEDGAYEKPLLDKLDFSR